MEQKDIELLKRTIYLMAERLKELEELDNKQYNVEDEIDIDCLIDNYIKSAKDKIEWEQELDIYKKAYELAIEEVVNDLGVEKDEIQYQKWYKAYYDGFIDDAKEMLKTSDLN